MARTPIPINQAVLGELIADVREVAFYDLANERVHRGEILRSASVVELFQNDPAELFARHTSAPPFVIPPLQVTMPSRHSPDGRLTPRVLGLSQSFGVYPALSMRAPYAPPNRRWPVILNALVKKLKRRSKDDFKGRHFEASLILQAVSWYLRYPLSYRDIEELFLERGLEVDHSTLNRWVLAYAPLIERRLRTFRKPHCGSIRVDETYIKIRGQWRYLYRAIDKHGN